MSVPLLVRVCGRCSEHRAAARLSEVLADLPQVRFEAIRCDEPCDTPDQLWLQQSGGAAYVFRGLDLAADSKDILATVRAYLAAPRGWIEDARPCGRLRFCLAARVPG